MFSITLKLVTFYYAQCAKNKKLFFFFLKHTECSIVTVKFSFLAQWRLEGSFFQ